MFYLAKNIMGKWYFLTDMENLFFGKQKDAIIFKSIEETERIQRLIDNTFIVSSK